MGERREGEGRREGSRRERKGRRRREGGDNGGGRDLAETLLKLLSLPLLLLSSPILSDLQEEVLWEVLVRDEVCGGREGGCVN